MGGAAVRATLSALNPWATVRDRACSEVVGAVSLPLLGHVQLLVLQSFPHPCGEELLNEVGPGLCEA